VLTEQGDVEVKQQICIWESVVQVLAEIPGILA